MLAEESWREFVTERGELVEHARFVDFVTTPPLKGLGASVELVDRIVGRDDPDLLRLLRKAKAVGQGRRTDLEEHQYESYRSSVEEKDADRLARDAPEEYEAVASGAKSIHRAAVDAGIRKRRLSVRLDDPESIARTLRRHLSPEALRELAELLREG